MSTHPTRFGRIAPAIAALTIAVAGFLPADAASSAAGCSDPTYVTGTGLACPAEDGLWRLTFPDGYTTTTHGPDWVNPIHGMNELLEVRRRDPSCVSDPKTDYHIQVVYSTPIDEPDRYSERLPYVRRMIERINGMLYKEGAEFNRPMRYRMACVKGKVSIKNVRLNLTQDRLTGSPQFGGLDYFMLVSELRRQGYTNEFAKYWLFFDARPPFEGLGGVASAQPDDRLAANNLSNFGPGYAVFYDVGEAFTTEAMMHEAAHLHGAVQDSAPNSTGNGHCIDDSDVMCYPDGGPNQAAFKLNICSRLHFDCNHDDYFNPRPKKNSYLATHWNLASPLNRFFAGCMYKIGQMTVGTAGQDVDGEVRGQVDGWSNLATASFKIPKKCRGRDFALTGAFPTLPRETDPAVGLTGPDPFALTSAFLGYGPPSHIVNSVIEPDFNVCFRKGANKCFTELGADMGRIPGTARKAVVTFNAGARGTWVFSAI